MKGKDLHPRLPYPGKLSFRMEGQIKRLAKLLGASLEKGESTGKYTGFPSLTGTLAGTENNHLLLFFKQRNKKINICVKEPPLLDLSDQAVVLMQKASYFVRRGSFIMIF